MAIVKKREKTRNQYPNDLKRKIAKEYLDGNASYGILAEENGLRDKSVVKEFVKWYKRQLEKEPDFDEIIEIKESEPMGKSVAELEKEIKVLKTRLRHEQLRTELLETVIDLAEEQLNIDIRKKSGTKQSKK